MSILRVRSRDTGAIASYPLGDEGATSYPYCNQYSSRIWSTNTRPAKSVEYCRDYLNPGPPYREGHSLFLRKLTAEYVDSKDVSVYAGYYRYEGSFGMSIGMPAEVTAAYNGFAETAGTWGATAFKRFRPVQPKVGAGQALGELRDFPSLFKLALKKFKDLGSAYLNYQFGWRPFIKDLLDFIETQKRIENHIRYVRNNNNKWIKRRGTLKDDTTTTTTSAPSYMHPALNSYLCWPIGSWGTGTKTLIVKDRIWFEGVMKYYIQGLEVDSCQDVWTSPLIRKLYGLELTPSLLYELTPWTWLIDWVLNVGDVLENFSNSMYDNLVAKYAYVMRTRSTSVVYSGVRTMRSAPLICDGNGRIIGFSPAVPGPTVTAAAKFEAICKERAKATQWGFGNEGDSITDRQLAILLALGLSRS